MIIPKISENQPCLSAEISGTVSCPVTCSITIIYSKLVYRLCAPAAERYLYLRKKEANDVDKKTYFYWSSAVTAARCNA